MAADGNLVLALAGSQIGTSCRSNRQQVIAYIQRSGGFVTPIPEKRSWCGDFAYWGLAQANAHPLPAMWHWNGQNSNAISRFFARYAETHNPLPGDMYYRPFIEVNGQRKDVEHVGFVIDPDFSPDLILTINGNASGLTADWTLGMGGGCVTIGTAPLKGGMKVHKFLAVAARPATIEGRWEVKLGVWTWHYIFLPGRTSPGMGEVLCTDIRNTLNVRFVGTWKNQADSLWIGWAKTNSEERWKMPLSATGQTGHSPNKGYSVAATQIEGKDVVIKTRFTYHLD
jgi:hypothetical protein